MTSPAEQCVAVLLASVLVAACGSEAGQAPPEGTASSSTSTTAHTVTCVEPPTTEISRGSEGQLFAETNPVAAGDDLYLSIDAPTDALDPVVGAAAVWQCWDGDTWVDTHQLLRDFGTGGPATIELTPGATTTIPAIELPVPNRHRVIVPDVAPGTYRITDSVFRADGNESLGFTIIEVTAG